MDETTQFLSIVLSIIVLITFFVIAARIGKIKMLITFPIHLKRKAIAKIVANADDGKESVLEFLTSYADQYKNSYGIEKQVKEIEKEYKKLITMAGITTEEITECCKLIRNK